MIKVNVDAPKLDPKNVPVTITMSLEDAYQLEEELNHMREGNTDALHRLFMELPVRGDSLPR